MKKILILVIFFSPMLFAGCSKSPEKISGTYVSPIVYKDYSCEQISLEMQRIASRVAVVSGAQRSKATSDAVATGVGIFVWPVFFFLMSDDQSAELASLKGQSQALEQTAIQKNCHRLIQQIEEERKQFEKSQEYE